MVVDTNEVAPSVGAEATVNEKTAEAGEYVTIDGDTITVGEDGKVTKYQEVDQSAQAIENAMKPMREENEALKAKLEGLESKLGEQNTAISAALTQILSEVSSEGSKPAPVKNTIQGGGEEKEAALFDLQAIRDAQHQRLTGKK